MRNRINNILIGLLWLLAATLGANFWFNTQFGFNIFSLQHWQYLAYMQATGQPVRAGFYISLIVIVAVAVFVLYELLQPRLRRITLPIVDNKTSTPQTTAPTKIIVPEPENNTPAVLTPTHNSTTLVRPPRLNISMPTQTRTPTPRVPLSSGTQRSNPETTYADIHEIFKSAGFVYKGSPRIKGIQTSVLAIGTGEVLWLGASGIKTADMQTAVDTLNGVFTDTLDDIEINVNAFIVGAPDANENASGSILQFASVDELRTYIVSHPNTPPDEDETENFDAYSGYIGTVVDYIGKI